MKSADEYAIVDQIIAHIGDDIRLATPLGAGKANHIVNAFYQRAKRNPNLTLKIYTALGLSRPQGKSLLEKRFLQPFNERVFDGYIELDYELDQMAGKLPANVEVIEFFYPAGKKLGLASAQTNYVSSNYTHVARDVIDAGVNVIAQIVSPSRDGKTYSLSCNPDVTPDIIEFLLKQATYPFAMIAQVNEQLPFMFGDAVVPTETFTHHLINSNYNFTIFAPPKMSVPEEDYMIGLYASTLVKDGGELQVGIGSLGDALVYNLVLRHKENATYRQMLADAKIDTKFKPLINKLGGLEPFDQGLFAASEMLVDGFMHLHKADILKKRVYDDLHIQRLLNEGLITEEIKPETLFLLIERRAIQPHLSHRDFLYLRKFGIFKKELSYENGNIILANGEKLPADCNVESHCQRIINECLGDRLKKGAVVHGGFFLGCQDFYNWLRQMPDQERKRIHMKSVSKINQLYGHEELDRLHRKDARLVNTCMMMTLLGAAVSDGLENGQVISGVGGQYNFVAMAHALPDGHSILQLRSTRQSKGEAKSNFVFNYGHTTIPRHLRDIVISEYGMVNIRGKTDSEVAAALIEIADSRFQQDLVRQAKEAGKLKSDYQIPDNCRQNYPQKIKGFVKRQRQQGRFPLFPFGTDFTDDEIKLGAALKKLKKKSNNKLEILKLLSKGIRRTANDEQNRLLHRMQLDQPQNFQERLYRWLILGELS